MREKKLNEAVQAYFDVMTKARPLDALESILTEDAVTEIVMGTDGKRPIIGSCNCRAEIVAMIARCRDSFTTLNIIFDIYRNEAELVELSYLADTVIQHPSAPDVSSTATYDVAARYELRDGRIYSIEERWMMRKEKRKRKKK